MNDEPISIGESPPGPFKTRIEALQVRVNKAALALHERNVRPTVQRIRTALGGGSPNDLAPALKRWREEVLPTLKTADDTPVGVPPLIADIVRELWTRALAAAAVEAVGGAKARRAIAQSEEVAALRGEIDRLRDQLEREQRIVGELRGSQARAEAIAKESLSRIDQAEMRARRAHVRLSQLMAAGWTGRSPDAPSKRGRQQATKRQIAKVGRGFSSRTKVPLGPAPSKRKKAPNEIHGKPAKRSQNGRRKRR